MSKELVTAKQAHARREQFLTLHHQANFLQMKAVYEIWKNRDYEILGFTSFKDYFEAPENSGGLGIKRSWAIQMAEVYQRYVVELGLTEDRMYKLSPRKLYSYISSVNEDNVEDIISKTTSLSLIDLELDKKGIIPEECEHDWEIFKKCRKCKTWSK